MTADSNNDLVSSEILLSQPPLEKGSHLMKMPHTTLSKLELTLIKKKHIYSTTLSSLNEVTTIDNGEVAMDEDDHTVKYSILPFATHHDIKEFVDMQYHQKAT